VKWARTLPSLQPRHAQPCCPASISYQIPSTEYIVTACYSSLVQSKSAEYFFACFIRHRGCRSYLSFQWLVTHSKNLTLSIIRLANTSLLERTPIFRAYSHFIVVARQYPVAEHFLYPLLQTIGYPRRKSLELSVAPLPWLCTSSAS